MWQWWPIAPVLVDGLVGGGGLGGCMGRYCCGSRGGGDGKWPYVKRQGMA